VVTIILCLHLYGDSWVGNKVRKAGEHLPETEQTAPQEGRLADGVVQGQRARSKKSKLQMPRKEVGVEMQIEKEGDSGHNTAVQPRERHAKEGLQDQDRSLLLLTP